MAWVLDYSFARPSPQVMRGVAVGVMRYLSGGGSKDLSASERDALFGAGLEIGLVWETTATRMNGGYPAGADDAQRANTEADGLGFPPDRPIYFANDQNSAFDVHVDYMRGARDYSGRPVGPYGNGTLIDRCANELGCRYGWKVSTWAGSGTSACLVQEANIGSPVSGTDVNTVLRDDWGQWHGSTTPPIQHSNPGVKGMLCLNKQDGFVYLVGPGHAHHVPTEEEESRLRFVGVPLVEFSNGLEIVGWGRTFGVPGWDQAATWQ